MSRPLATGCAILALALCGARPVAAQSDDGAEDAAFRIVAAAGPTINDFETTGIDWIFVAGAEWRPRTWSAIVLFDVGYLSWEPAGREQLVMPEIGIQFQVEFGPVHPFVGTGIGWQKVIREGDDAASFTGHLETGFRIRLGSSVDLRLEMRGRSVDPAIGFTAGLAIGL